MNDHHERPSDDDRLNELFGEFVAALSDGREVIVEALLADRPDLIARAKELLSIAREIAVRRPVEIPSFAGYELLSEIGQGGMGKVYLARHIELGRTVALKTLPPQWMTGDRAKQRFEREAKAIARLKHPNIIPIYDVGEADGIPYFTMEFVKGRTLSSLLRSVRESGEASHKLTSAHLGRAESATPNDSYVRCMVRSALEIARALEHAHAEGVVHRDVKPSNVLWRVNGMTMLFDFGLATVEAEEALTITGEFVGTPHYVSPEQALGQRPGPLTDVFSLGATLYELLTLERPFTGVTNQDVLRQVQERDPRPPSRLNGAVPRDLETICMTALAKEPTRRYSSAKALADDLEAFLQSRPIRARHVGLVARGLLLARRHPVVTLSVVLALLLFVGTPSALLLQAKKANREVGAALVQAEASQKVALAAEAKAVHERDIAQEFSDVLENMIASVDPTSGGREVRVFEILESMSNKIEGLRPEVRAALEKSLGTTYLSLMMFPEAEQHFERAKTLFEELPETSLATQLEIRVGFVLVHQALSRYEKAIELAPAIVEEYRQAGIFTDGTGDVISAWGLALNEKGYVDEAEKVLREGLLASQAASPVGQPGSSFEHNLGLVLCDKGNFVEGIALITSAWERSKVSEGAEGGNTVESLMLLAQVVAESGDLDAADPLMVEAARLSRLVFGEEDLRAVVMTHNLAGLRFSQDRLEEAEKLELEALELAEQCGEAGKQSTGYIYEVLGNIQTAAGKVDAAAASQRSSLEIRAMTLSEQNPLLVQTHFLLGRRLRAVGDFDGAEAQGLLAREGYAGMPEEAQGMLIFYILGDLAELYQETGDSAKNEEVLAELRVLREQYADDAQPQNEK